MNKLITTLLCFTLIFGIFSGCIETNTTSIPINPIIGTWKTEQNGSGDIIFFEDGSAIYHNSKVIAFYNNSNGTWEFNNDTLYFLSFPNASRHFFVFQYNPRLKTLKNLNFELGVYKKTITVSTKTPRQPSIFANPIIGTWKAEQNGSGDIIFFENGIAIFDNSGGTWGKINDKRYFVSSSTASHLTLGFIYNPQSDTLDSGESIIYRRAAFSLSTASHLTNIFAYDPRLDSRANSNLILNRISPKIPTNILIGNWNTVDDEYENIIFFENGTATYGNSRATWEKKDNIHIFLSLSTASHHTMRFMYNPQSDTLDLGDVVVYTRG